MNTVFTDRGCGNSSTPGGRGEAAAVDAFCGHCGESRQRINTPERINTNDDGGSSRGAQPTGGGASLKDHRRCEEFLAMEPPRYCSQCRRRLKVQVTPLGWTAECSRHGLTEG